MGGPFSNNQENLANEIADSISSQTESTNEYSSFGELITVHEKPKVQGSFTYSNNTFQFEEFSATGGSVSNSNALATCQTGTNIGGYGLIRTVEYGIYRPGQGLAAKFTAMFTTGVALSRQAAGFVASGNEVSFGYNGTDFCVLLRTNGALEIQTLTVGTGAAGPGNVTIELDGSSTAVPVTAGSVQLNATEIAAGSYTGWTAFQRDDTVVFIATATGNKTGSFSFTDTDTTGTAASFAETQAGRTPEDTFINQEDWNVDKMDGTGVTNPSGMTLDPTKLNVYKINLQYLGAGAIEYKIENETTGRFQTVHKIAYANANTSVSLRNPTFKLGWFAASLGSTTNLSVSGASGSISLQGDDEHTGMQTGVTNIKTGIGATLTNILTIRLDEEFKGIVSQAKIKLEAINIGAEASGNNVSQIQMLRNATVAGTQNFQMIDSEYPISMDTAGTTVTGGDLFIPFPLSKSDSRSENLIDFEYTAGRGDTITIAGNVSGGSVELRVGLTFEILI